MKEKHELSSYAQKGTLWKSWIKIEIDLAKQDNNFIYPMICNNQSNVHSTHAMKLWKIWSKNSSEKLCSSTSQFY